MTTKSMTKTLTEIIEKTRTKPEGQREMFALCYLQRAYPDRTHQGLASLVKHVLRHSGN